MSAECEKCGNDLYYTGDGGYTCPVCERDEVITKLRYDIARDRGIMRGLVDIVVGILGKEIP